MIFLVDYLDTAHAAHESDTFAFLADGPCDDDTSTDPAPEVFRVWLATPDKCSRKDCRARLLI